MVATPVSATPPEARQQTFIRLYQQAFPRVAHFVSRMGGRLEEAQDVFQDALVIYYERSVDPTLPAPDDEAAYLLGISRHLWIKQYRSRPPQVPLEETEALASVENETPSHQKLVRFLASAGQKCMNLLRAFYYDRVPLDELADRFGFAGTRSATVQKYKCLEKVRTTVKEKLIQYEDFLDND